jgi:hypothetical protein
LFTCGSSSTYRNLEETEKTQPIVFPYKYIGDKREERKNDGSYNEMTLYTCGNKVDIDTLKMFCKSKKDSITDGYFHIITFFIDKKHAKFTEFPVTSMYGMDETPAKYIKADYTYNMANGYSKLTVYDKNSWISKGRAFDIK